MNPKGDKDYWQYLSIGCFTLPILLIAFFISYENRNKELLLISSYSIFYDLTLLILLKTLSYHYFLYTLPFVSLCFSYSFFSKKSLFIRTSLILIIVLSLFFNLSSIDFYLNKDRSKYIEEIASYIASNIENEKIWGEPSIVSYVGFSRNVSVASNYLDPFIDYWRYLNEERIIEFLKKERPRFIIDMNFYLMSSNKLANFVKDYYKEDVIFEERRSGVTYLVYRRIY